MFEIENRYWFTKFEIIEVIWIIKKIRHMIEFCRKSLIIIFIDHSTTADIIKQISFTTESTKKLNFRLIKISQYFSASFIKIKIKSKKFHLIPNALSRLKSTYAKKKKSTSNTLKKLNVEKMFVENFRMKKNFYENIVSYRVNEALNVYLNENIYLFEMIDDLKKKFKSTYKNDSQWKKIQNKIKTRQNQNDTFDEMNFIAKKFRILYASSNKIFRLCVPWKFEKKVYQLIHDSNHHCGFHRAYARASKAVYIRHLIERFRRYIRHCKQCLKVQIMRHAFYDELIFIKTMTFSFHIITIDFIVAFSIFESKMNAIFIITDKFFKRINIISKKTTWSTFEWTASWFEFLQKKNWKFSRAILSNRDRKFVTAFWKTIFNHLKIALLFITVYHPQTDGQSKRTNQTIKIVLKYAFMKKNCTDFIKLLTLIQIMINNFQNIITSMFSNEILYEFRVAETTDLLNDEKIRKKMNDDNSSTNIENEKKILRKKIIDAINFGQTMQKFKYDINHKPLNLKKNVKIYIRLHKKYSQPDLKNRKFDKQKIGSIEIIKKVKKLIYRFDIFNTWKIHSVISIIHFESISEKKNPFQKKPIELESIKTDENDDSDLYEIEKIIVKKKIHSNRERHRRNHTEFRMKWLKWKNQHNKWMKKDQLNECVELLTKFENTEKFSNIAWISRK